MKNGLIILLVITIFTSCHSVEKDSNKTKIETTKQLLHAMKSKNDNSWFRYFTFKQHTIFYDTAGQKTDSALWHEAVSYPYLFRIDRDINRGNYTIYRNDSTYHILADTLYSAAADPAVHLLFKGGLYFIPLNEAIEKLEKYGFNLQSFRKDEFMNELVYVIGDESKQFWLHAEEYYCMRRVSTDSQNKKVDVVYENFKTLGGGWVEQKVTFYFDGYKRMEEFYLDIELRDTINDITYNPKENYRWWTDH